MVNIDYLVKFVEEDSPFGDITSEAVIKETDESEAVILSMQDGIIAGLEEAEALFRHYGLKAGTLLKDGNQVKKGAHLMKIKGNTRKILLLERTVLNLLGRMSGIATETRMIADRVKKVNQRVKIAGTRKTLLKPIDKKAILVGGGEPHRFSLSDSVLIKDNHLLKTSIEEAIENAKRFSLYKIVEVEVKCEEEAMKAINAGADVVMFDNFSPEEASKTIESIRKKGLRNKVKLELSGGITSENIENYAKLDVDVISLGYLTHSIKNFDLSLKILA
jgi:nicotinate-nucleotide pyrophosphorylase (carboxylating)